MTELQETSRLIPPIFICTYTALAFGQIPGLRIDRVGIGLGVIVHYFTLTGMPTQWLEDLNKVGLNPHNPFLLTLVTAILSVGVNNIPAVMLLISTLGTSSLLDGEILAVASSFAGNFLMIASVANFIMVQQAEAHGIHILLQDHAKIGIPSTILSLGVLMGWLWLQHSA